MTRETKITREELLMDLMNDSTKYCCYCGTQKHSMGCCGENHFETFAQMDALTQEEFLDYEWEQLQPKKASPAYDWVEWVLGKKL